jgi:hypothetical protein
MEGKNPGRRTAEKVERNPRRRRADEARPRRTYETNSGRTTCETNPRGKSDEKDESNPSRRR